MNHAANISDELDPEVAPLVEDVWKKAQIAGYGIERYRLQPEDMFGSYNQVRGGAKAA